MHELSLDHLTVPTLTPPEQIVLASEVGCRAVSIRVQPQLDDIPSLDMIGDTPMRRETKRRSEVLGVDIYLIEVFMLFKSTDVEEFRPALESGAELGASVANAPCMDRDLARFNDRLAHFAEIAAELGLKTSVEPLGAGPLFTPVEARAATDATGRDDAGIMTDILHIVRAGYRPGDVATTFEPERILYAQISDGPLDLPDDEVIAEAVSNRHVPGDGEFPLRDFVAMVPDDVPIGVEVPMQRLVDAGATPGEVAARAVAATRRVLSHLAITDA